MLFLFKTILTFILSICFSYTCAALESEIITNAIASDTITISQDIESVLGLYQQHHNMQAVIKQIQSLWLNLNYNPENLKEQTRVLLTKHKYYISEVYDMISASKNALYDEIYLGVFIFQDPREEYRKRLEMLTELQNIQQNHALRSIPLDLQCLLIHLQQRKCKDLNDAIFVLSRVVKLIHGGLRSVIYRSNTRSDIDLPIKKKCRIASQAMCDTREILRTLRFIKDDITLRRKTLINNYIFSKLDTYLITSIMTYLSPDDIVSSEPILKEISQLESILIPDSSLTPVMFAIS